MYVVCTICTYVCMYVCMYVCICMENNDVLQLADGLVHGFGQVAAAAQERRVL